MTNMFLDHPFLLAMCLFVFLMAVVDTGFRLAVLTGANLDDDSREQIAASRDSLGILLSFMLGFTLAMALPRFDLRKHLLMEEANAIAARFAHSSCNMFRSATPIRRRPPGEREMATTIDRTKSLQSALWQKAEEAARQSPTAMTAQFVTSLNETIDLSEKRLTALENRIPKTIWLMLLLIALMTCFTFGYWQRKRFWLVAVVSPLMIAIVMGLIADLDSSRSGFLRGDLRSLERVAQDLGNAPSTSPDALPHSR